MARTGLSASRQPRTHPDALPGRARRGRGRPILLDAENEAAANHVRFDKPDQKFVSDSENPPGSSPDQSMGCLVALIVVAGQSRYRNKPMGSVLSRSDE